MTTGIGVTGAAVSYGFSAVLINNATIVHQQLNTLAEQASSGLIAQTYAGLGGGAGVALDLSPHITSLQTYQDNIGRATGSMRLTQVSMGQIQQIAAKFVAQIPNMNGLNPTLTDSIAANARSALTQVAQLLDSQNGSAYIFGGQDNANPPVPDPNDILSSGFYTQINTAVTSLSANGAAATIAATLSIAGSNASGTSPFSAYLSQPASALKSPVVQTGDGTTEQIGMLASANSAVTSTGTSTTGSYMRDLMRALATLGSLSSAQVNDPNFAPLVQDTATVLTGVVSTMATDVGVMGDRQSRLTDTQTQLSNTAVALKTQVSVAQDADIATTLTQLTAVQTQLQESYRLIAAANSLSLVNFLP